MAAHWIASTWYVPLLAAIGHVSAGHHAACDGGQGGETFVNNIDALVSGCKLLEAAQSLTSGHNVFCATAIGEIEINSIEMVLSRV